MTFQFVDELVASIREELQKDDVSVEVRVHPRLVTTLLWSLGEEDRKRCKVIADETEKCGSNFDRPATASELEELERLLQP